MPSPLLSTLTWVVALFATLFGVISLVRGVAHLWREFSGGQPDHTRTRPVGQRLWGLLSAALTHREFKGRPAVKAAHWLVMISFPLLFLTLVSGYAQLRDPSWALPLIGHFPPWEWLTEFFAWGGLLGIAWLMVVRRRAGHGAPGEAALSGGDAEPPSSARPAPASPRGTIDEGDTPHPADLPAEAPTPAPSSPSPRDGSPRGIASRFLGSTRWQALFVEWVVLIVCACVVALRALEYAHLGTDPATAHLASAWHFPMTAWIGALLGGVTPLALANAIVIVSAVKITTSMLWMMVVGVQTSAGVAWHRFLAVVNLYARRNADGSKALGPAAPMLNAGEPVRDLEDLPEDATLGVGTADDLTWKDRLDFYSCTECGRCQEMCPAWNTQKPLSPKLLVLAMRDHLEAVSNIEVTEVDVEEVTGPDGEITRLVEKGVDPAPHSFDVLSALSQSGATGPLGVAVADGPLVPDVITEDVLWDCTMCGACVDQCPVDIEHVDHILDLRRHQVLMESAFPRELGRAFRGMETKANPYNQPARKRLDWAKGLDFEVPVIGEDLESAQDVDYLFWVGCAGAYDDRAKATTAAVAELLHTAGVSFAVLGSGESCTGDPARRAGNEVLFQMLAGAAIDTLHEARAQRIVVTCAHCFNTIAGEFPELGGTFEVIHHTQLLNRLVRDGKLRPVAPPASPGPVGAGDSGTARATAGAADTASDATAGAIPITYHDPCFLGRHNQVYEPPRELIGSLPGLELVEMPRSREGAMCCGAGGARAWMEETRGIRIADARMTEAASTGAAVVATACPFCSQMLGSATGASAGFGTSGTPAGPGGSADAGSGSTGADEGGAAKLPEVRDVALLLLDGVRRGLDEHLGPDGDHGANGH
ncbi:heterodisulfide reductase-related iron-sulfur binding cluster [Actinomyces sp.]|uniref:(Fe-S)-binding protein n=1 Tax=Actinomyces sp. TaxID=29317 RepID=UPI0028A05F8E|nr:heterodisulfide reductase-related iron-sulfur binding cluster [Actinomyces sp.]